MNPRHFIFALSAALLFGLAPASPLRAQNDQDDAPSASQHLRVLTAPHRRSANDNDQVVVLLGDNTVDAGQTVHDAVAVLSDLTVDGHCQGDAVAVLGSNTVNGTVDRDVVCVMGDLTLGPKAHVEHDVVCVMGTLHRDPGAYVGGSVVQQGKIRLAPLHNWWLLGLSHGKLLPLGPHVAWLWVMNLLLIGVYVLVALLFPAAMVRTGDMLVERPFQVLLAGFLGIIAFPVLFILLLVTVVGIPVAILVLPVACFCLVYFGKASLYGLIGRKLTAEKAPVPLAVLIGGLVALFFLAFPFVSILFYLVMSYLGFGCAVTALLQTRKSPPVVVPPAAPGPVPTSPRTPTGSTADGAERSERFGAEPPASSPPPVYPSPLVDPTTPAAASAAYSDPTTFSAAPPPPFPSPPPITSIPQSPLPPPLPIDATLPRATFWARTGAMLIDIILVGIAVGFLDSTFGSFSFGPVHHHDSGGSFLFFLALYAALMWKIRGTTVGGLILHLQVVRLDGRPIDWPTAIVRALGCFISLFVAGLGFIWVAFDPERQSWHDKLAGTTVVISVTRRSLV